MNEDLIKLPDELLQSENDGTCNYLLGKMVLNISLPS